MRVPLVACTGADALTAALERAVVAEAEAKAAKGEAANRHHLTGNGQLGHAHDGTLAARLQVGLPLDERRPLLPSKVS